MQYFSWSWVYKTKIDFLKLQFIANITVFTQYFESFSLFLKKKTIKISTIHNNLQKISDL